MSLFTQPSVDVNELLSITTISSPTTQSILYVTGQSKYKGVLSRNKCTDDAFWNELLQPHAFDQERKQQSVHDVITEWNNRVSAQNPNEYQSEISQFRIVIHKTQRIQLSCNTYSDNIISNCKHFALVWIPSNDKQKMLTREINAMIKAMRESNYFVNLLNKECVYISGPKYKKTFDLESLKRSCHNSLPVTPDDVELELEIAVHELDRQELWKEYQNDFRFDVFRSEYENISRHVSLESIEEPSELVQTSSTEIPSTHFKPSKNQTTAAHMDTLCFAFVWVTVSRSNRSRSQSSRSLNMISSLKQRKTGSGSDLKKALLTNYESYDDKINSFEYFSNGIYSALSILHGLHQKLIGDSKVKAFNVELMGYDECFANMNLTTNTYGRTSWGNSFVVLAVMVFLQCMLLPLFIIIPPMNIIKYFKPKFSVQSRRRPTGSDQYLSGDDVETPYDINLDVAEQIPYDISCLWRSPNKKISKCRKLVEVVISTAFLAILYVGIALYRKQAPNYVNTLRILDFSFFDCFGPFLFHVLGTITIIFWCCVYRGLIGPKEHVLLYHKMIVQIPARKAKPTNDFDALTFLSEHTLMNAFEYAHRRQFLEGRIPTHRLLSGRVIRCKNKYTTKQQLVLKWIFYVICIGLYFVALNLEDFEICGKPFCIESNQYYFRLMFCIVSNGLSCVQLWFFIVLWESMINRIKGYYLQIDSLSNLIMSNAKSEYICLDKVDNLLSWIALEEFVKRRGRMLFAWLETPVLSLFVLAFFSWSGTLYGLFWGEGLELKTDKSLFSNSALATWFYLTILSLGEMARLCWYGHRFHVQSKKQRIAIRSQCNTIHTYNLMELSKTNQMSVEQKYALQSSHLLLTHWQDHEEMVPRVFGIKFDDLTAKAIWTAVISAMPTILKYILSQIN